MTVAWKIWSAGDGGKVQAIFDCIVYVELVN